MLVHVLVLRLLVVAMVTEVVAAVIVVAVVADGWRFLVVVGVLS